jgi:putative membrane protein
MWITMNKAATLAFWLLALASYIMQWPGLLSYLPLAALIVASAHVLETAFFWFALKANSKRPAKDAVLIMVFGIFHLQRFMTKAAA